MDDWNLLVIKEEGFCLVDCIVEVCFVEGIYIIFDMYMFLGG